MNIIVFCSYLTNYENDYLNINTLPKDIIDIIILYLGFCLNHFKLKPFE